jgi:transcriptional regulator with XRE-family HTH domain
VKNSKAIEDEIERCRLLLRASIRVSGLSVAEVERRLGLRPRTLQRVLLGRFDLKLRHILAVLGVLGIDYEAFYRAAAERRQVLTTTGVMERMREAGLRGRRSQMSEEPDAEDAEKFQQLVDAVVEQTLERLGLEGHRGGHESGKELQPRLAVMPVKPRPRQAPRGKKPPI